MAFAEKPDLQTAERYLAEGGYLWNSGMFMVRASQWLAAVERYRPDIAAGCREAIAGARADGVFLRLDKTAFAACPSESIDYAVMERLGTASAGSEGTAGRPALQTQPAPPARGRGRHPGAPLRGAVIPLTAGWSDLGAWDAVWAASPKDDGDNVVYGNVIIEDGRGSLVQAQSRLVATLGVDDLAIIETARRRPGGPARPDRRPQEVGRPGGRPGQARHPVPPPRVPPLGMVRVHGPGPPLPGEASYGRARRLIEPAIPPSPGRALGGGVGSRGGHLRTARSSASKRTNPPTCLAEAPHRLANPGTEPVEIIEVQSGDYLGEDDIVRLEDDYGRMEDK